MRRMPRPNRVRDAALLDLATHGTPVAALAARFGITRNAVIGALWRARRRARQPEPPPALNQPSIPLRAKPGPIARGFRMY
jgi:hypothetical protein